MPLSLLSKPSIRKLFDRGRSPFTENEAPFVRSSRLWTVTTPGSVGARANGLPDGIGRLRIYSCGTVPEIAPVSVWTCSTASDTTTVVVAVGSRNETFSELTVDVCTWKLLTCDCAKPVAVTVTWYGPGVVTDPSGQVIPGAKVTARSE